MNTKLFLRALVPLMLTGTLAACGSTAPGGSTTPGSTNEEGFPEGPITLIVPYGPGGGTDLTARTIAPYLEDELGVPVVIENKEGAGGWVGWGELVNSEPDGHTLAYMNFPNVIVGYLNPETARQENLDSFTFLSNHVEDAGVIAVLPNPNYKTIDELIEYAKTNELTMTTSGAGSANHVLGVQMNAELGTKFQFVPSDGAGQYVPQVLGGHVDVMVAGIAETKEFIESGELLPLAVFGDERLPDLPDVPTLNESAEIETQPFLTRGIAAPAGLDPDAEEKLMTAIENALADEQQIAQIEEMGMSVRPMQGEEYATYRSELESTIQEMLPQFGW